MTDSYRNSPLRFEVDGANAARDFLRSYGIPEASVETVWDAIALHTTPGIPEHKKAEVALVTAGVEMDVLGFAYERFTPEQREAVVAAHPRGAGLKKNIIDAFYEGMKHRPDSTFGTVNDECPGFQRPQLPAHRLLQGDPRIGLEELSQPEGWSYEIHAFFNGLLLLLPCRRFTFLGRRPGVASDRT